MIVHVQQLNEAHTLSWLNCRAPADKCIVVTYSKLLLLCLFAPLRACVACADSEGAGSGDEYDPDQQQTPQPQQRQPQQRQQQQRQRATTAAVSPVLGVVHSRDEDILSDELRRMWVGAAAAALPTGSIVRRCAHTVAACGQPAERSSSRCRR
jgi:hypothetical protein